MKTARYRFHQLFLLCLLVGAPSSIAQSPPYERVLFPIVTGNYPVAGANGSLWLTEQSVLNRSGADVRLYGSYYCWMCSSKYGEIHFSPDAAYLLVPLAGQDGIPGSFLFVDRSAVNDVVSTSRIRDLSRTDHSFGAELPVVHEAAFSASRIDLLGIPTDARFRRTLRVYAASEVGGVFRVSIFSETGSSGSVGLVSPIPAVPDPLLGNETFTMIEPRFDNVARENFPAFASVGEIPFIGEAGRAAVRVEITPVTPGLRIWAFVSVTNNDTQEVTIVSPQ